MIRPLTIVHFLILRTVCNLCTNERGLHTKHYYFYFYTVHFVMWVNSFVLSTYYLNIGSNHHLLHYVKSETVFSDKLLYILLFITALLVCHYILSRTSFSLLTFGSHCLPLLGPWTYLNMKPNYELISRLGAVYRIGFGHEWKKQLHVSNKCVKKRMFTIFLTVAGFVLQLLILWHNNVKGNNV